ncbi:MAG: hypothetical protein KDA65_07280 [Planctomycetaceae bacterium]|nr:hypothetical protein [Planctomycetaceae bacterium]
MNTSLLFQLILSLFSGLLLGAIFFGGLWMTVKNLKKTRHPAPLFLMSALGRTLLTLSGFWFVGVWLSPEYQWQRLVACLLGFFLMRHISTRYIESGTTPTTQDLRQ